MGTKLELNPLEMAKDLVGKKLDSGKEKKELVQFEECDIKNCIYHNHEGYCSYETCIVKTESPMTASMVMKICMFCGNEFSTCMSGMNIQCCPACLEGCLKAEGHPHKCMFCGKKLDGNPSIFFPVCDKCFEKLQIVATGSKRCVDLAANSAHCDSCG